MSFGSYSCCCDWGFEFVYPRPTDLWYMAQGNVGAATERLEKALRSNADTVQFSSFSNASLVQAMGELSGTLYFYSYNGPTLVKKYDFGGNLQWTYSAGAGIINSQPGGFSNNTHRLNVDASGNVYLVATAGSAGSRKLVAEKIDSSGSQVWTQQVSHHGGSGDYWGLFIASDTSGNVAAVGTGGITYFNSSGTQQWGVNVFGHKVCFDASGNVYILRNTSPASVWSYDNTGAFRFSVSLTGATSTFQDIEIFNSKLYASWYNSSTSKVFLSRRSDSTFSTVDWSIEITYTNAIIEAAAARPRIAVDEIGDLYVCYSTIDGSSNRFGHLHRLAAADGSTVYTDARSVDCLNPMIPPGRPPIFF